MSWVLKQRDKNECINSDESTKILGGLSSTIQNNGKILCKDLKTELKFEYMYILGVDGGGTKIEFMVADFEGNSVLSFQYNENTNLKYSSSQKIIEVLQKGFAQIQGSIEPKQIKFAYLGIAECGENCVGRGRGEIVRFLQTQFDSFELADDQYSVFRAKTNNKNGVLANAGTGSNINHFQDGKELNYKSVGTGGRDLGHMFLSEIKYGGILEDSQIYSSTTAFLQQDPIQFFDSLKPLESMLHNDISRLPRYLILQSQQNALLAEEINIFAIFVASRWSLKLTSYCNLNFGYQPTDAFDIALTGSLWRWDRMREIVLKDLKISFPKANVIFDPEKKSVQGAVKIALKRINN